MEGKKPTQITMLDNPVCSVYNLSYPLTIDVYAFAVRQSVITFV